MQSHTHCQKQGEKPKAAGRMRSGWCSLNADSCALPPSASTPTH